MRKPMIAGLTVALLTGIVYAQDIPEIWPKTPTVNVHAAQRVSASQCQQMAPAAKFDVDTIIARDGQSFRCTYVYDEWLTRTGRVAWVKVTP
jgi:hypothetical protein